MTLLHHIVRGANDSELGEAEMRMQAATKRTYLTLFVVANDDPATLGVETVPSDGVS